MCVLCAPFAHVDAEALLEKGLCVADAFEARDRYYFGNRHVGFAQESRSLLEPAAEDGFENGTSHRLPESQVGQSPRHADMHRDVRCADAPCRILPDERRDTFRELDSR